MRARQQVVEMLFLRPDHLLGGGLTNAPGQSLAGQRVSGRIDPIVECLSTCGHFFLNTVSSEIVGGYLSSSLLLLSNNNYQ